MKVLGNVDADEVSPVFRAANRRRVVLKEAGMNQDVADIMAVPWEHEGAMLDEIRKAGAGTDVQEAAVAALRLLKGVEEDLPAEMREAVEKLGREMYPVEHPQLNTSDKNGGADDAAEPDDDCDDMDVTKRQFSADERKTLASSGAAMPDGSYPIKTKEDLSNAIHALGRGKNNPKSAIKAHIKARAKALGAEDMIPDTWKGSGKVSKAFSALGEALGITKETDEPEPELPDEPAGDDTNVQKGGTMAEEGQNAVPVKKEDGTWDLTGVPEPSRPFYEAILKSNDTLAEQNVQLRKEVDETKGDLAKKEFIAKAEQSYAKLAPAEELGVVLKEASEKMDPETFELLTKALDTAAERVATGDLFVEKGRSAIGMNDGSSTDAWAKIEKAAAGIVEKDGDGISQAKAIDRVLKERPELYSEYLVQAAGGVS